MHLKEKVEKFFLDFKAISTILVMNFVVTCLMICVTIVALNNLCSYFLSDIKYFMNPS